MLAAGARPKDTKINLMDCICLCSEVEIAFLFKVGLASTTACSFCGDMDESLEYLITSCHSKNLWAEVIK